MSERTVPSHKEPSVGELMTQLSEQTSRLVRDELALAKVEMTEKAKHAGIGAGLFSAAGLLALFGLGTLIATAVLALDLVLPAWLAALIVALAVLAAAGIAALVGKQRVQQATPAAPEQAIENIKQDVETVKEARHHDHASH
ncbi:MAG: phage holin family protein [Nocardioidaceae bacterium]